MANHPITHKAIKFGKRFGQSRYVIKSKLSFGELVEIYCLLKLIYLEGEFCLMLDVNIVRMGWSQ